MKIAIEGCCHGELDAIYGRISELERRNNYTVDVVLICGDFQAIRNSLDLGCMSVPQKYKRLGGFHKYYTGQTTAPYLTIVIGGNHEASNYFWELYHGGWIAPNIYFLGHAGCVRVNGIRIAGASGIFKPGDFRLGHYERLPYTVGSMKSIYHIREYSIRRLSLLGSPDVFLSHDWPQGIEHHGDLPGLLRRKTFLRSDIEKGELGSPPLTGLLHTLRPAHWFSAHLHCRYAARVLHVPLPNAEVGAPAASTAIVNPDEIAIDFDDDEGTSTSAPTVINPNEINIDFDVNIPAHPTAPAPSSLQNPEEININLDDEGLAAHAASELVSAAASTSAGGAAPTLINGEVDALIAEVAEAVGQPSATSKVNPDEITLDDEELEVEVVKPAPTRTAVVPSVGGFVFGSAPGSQEGRVETHFLALDKCLPRRDYLEVIDYPTPPNVPYTPGQPTFTFDRSWLSIMRAFNPYFSRTRMQSTYPSEEEARAAIAQAREWVDEHVYVNDPAKEVEVGSVQKFDAIAPRGEGSGGRTSGQGQPVFYPNPQTQAVCELIGIENMITG